MTSDVSQRVRNCILGSMAKEMGVEWFQQTIQKLYLRSSKIIYEKFQALTIAVEMS